MHCLTCPLLKALSFFLPYCTHSCVVSMHSPPLYTHCLTALTASMHSLAYCFSFSLVSAPLHSLPSCFPVLHISNVDSSFALLLDCLKLHCVFDSNVILCLTVNADTASIMASVSSDSGTDACCRPLVQPLVIETSLRSVIDPYLVCCDAGGPDPLDSSEGAAQVLH